MVDTKRGAKNTMLQDDLSKRHANPMFTLEDSNKSFPKKIGL